MTMVVQLNLTMDSSILGYRYDVNRDELVVYIVHYHHRDPQHRLYTLLQQTQSRLVLVHWSNEKLTLIMILFHCDINFNVLL